MAETSISRFVATEAKTAHQRRRLKPQGAKEELTRSINWRFSECRLPSYTYVYVGRDKALNDAPLQEVQF